MCQTPSHVHERQDEGDTSSLPSDTQSSFWYGTTMKSCYSTLKMHMKHRVLGAQAFFAALEFSRPRLVLE